MSVNPTAEDESTAREQPRRRHRRIWQWVLVIGLLSIVALFTAGQILIQRAEPILKGRVVETLRTEFNSHVELDRLNVSMLHGIDVTGGGLRIFPPDDVMAAGARAPLISVSNFSFHSTVRSLWVRPMHINTVYLSGLVVTVPPRSQRAQAAPGKHGKKIKIIANRLEIENSMLVLETDKPGKEPKRFVLREIIMQQVGSALRPWNYQATLVNAIPKGDIHATGSFGPWNVESPGDSSLDGRYTFDSVQLSPIKGIGGILSSHGRFEGQLNRIETDGETDTPAFTLDSANEPMPLHTTFHAIVDGMNGDTHLDPVHAVLGSTHFTCSGDIINIRGVGHATDLDVEVPDGRIADFLRLAVRTRPPVLRSMVRMKAHLHIRAGKGSVLEKLQLSGEFRMRDMRFTNPKVQEKLDELSLTTEGHAKEAEERKAAAQSGSRLPPLPGQEMGDVASRMSGTFDLKDRRMRFPVLQYTMPGAHMELTGVYTLDGRTFDFHGSVRTKAKVSQMVASRWKSFLLKAVDPFFAKGTGGAVIPVQISGTEGAPKFGLDWHHMSADDDLQRRDRHP